MNDEFKRQLNVRFPEEAVERIEKAAKKVGLKPTQFVRTAVMKILETDHPMEKKAA